MDGSETPDSAPTTYLAVIGEYDPVNGKHHLIELLGSSPGDRDRNPRNIWVKMDSSLEVQYREYLQSPQEMMSVTQARGNHDRIPIAGLGVGNMRPAS